LTSAPAQSSGIFRARSSTASVAVVLDFFDAGPRGEDDGLERLDADVAETLGGVSIMSVSSSSAIICEACSRLTEGGTALKALAETRGSAGGALEAAAPMRFKGVFF
jgi:hypothetical protein